MKAAVTSLLHVWAGLSLAVFIVPTLMVATAKSDSVSTYYVNAATGNDTTGDGSERSPWATIGKAFASVPSNEDNTVYMAPGTYDQEGTVNQKAMDTGYTTTFQAQGAVLVEVYQHTSGTASILYARGNGSFVFKGANTGVPKTFVINLFNTGDGEIADPLFIIGASDSPNITLEDVEVFKGPSTTGYIGYSSVNGSFTCRRCYLHDFYSNYGPIRADSPITIESSYIKQWGLWANSGSGLTRWVNNTFYTTDEEDCLCAILNGPNSSVTIQNNLFLYSGSVTETWQPIFHRVDGDITWNVSNNIAWKVGTLSSPRDINNYPTVYNFFSRNNIVNNLIVVDPIAVDPANSPEISATSLAVGRGTNTGVTTDFRGLSFTPGRYDIGAWAVGDSATKQYVPVNDKVALVVGDSFCDGSAADGDTDDFDEALAATGYFNDWTFVQNPGEIDSPCFSGGKLIDMSGGIGEFVQDYGPSAVFLIAGINDRAAGRGAAWTINQVEAYENILADLTNNQAHFLYITQPDDGCTPVTTVADAIESGATFHHARIVERFKEDNAWSTYYNCPSDPIHPNPTGYAKMAQYAEEAYIQYYDPAYQRNFSIIISIAAYPKGDRSLTVDFYSIVVGGNLPYTYAWDFGDGSSSNEANPTRTYASQGVYSVTLIVSDGQTEGQKTITVNPTEDAFKPKAEYAYKSTQSQWTAYISPDIATRLYFFATDPRMPKEPQGTYWIHVVVPEGVTPVGISTRRSTYSGPPESIQDLGPLSCDGKDYHYYKVEIPHSSWTLEFFLYVKTTLEVGTRTTMYYWGSSIEQGSSVEMTTQERSLPVEVISVHKVQNKPKRLLIGEGWENMSTYTAWPNFEEEYSSLGLNLILLTEMGSDGSFGSRKPAIQQFVDDANSAGINIGIAMEPGAIMNYYLKGHPEAQAIRPDGTIWTNGSQLSLCPCYRGELFDKIMLDPMREIASAGISFVAFDYEMGYDGQLSFSDLCLSKFQTYLATEYPQLNYLDPRVFEAQPDEYPEYHEAWAQFMTDQIAEWFSLQKQTLEEAVQEYGAHSSPGVYIGDYGDPASFSYAAELLFYQPKNLQNGLDFVMPTSYQPWDPEVIRDKAWWIRVYTGYDGWGEFAYPAPNLLYWTTLGWTGGGAMMGPTGRYQFLEILAQGARGFVLYDGSGLDARNFDMLSRIIDAIAPVEDIVIDGEHIIADTSDLETVAHGQKLGDEMVLVVSDYGTEQKESTVTVPVTKESTVYNLETGEKMGTLTPQNDTFTATFAENRAVLVHISPAPVPGDANGDGVSRRS